MRNLLLDTDIGTDVDDALALAYAARAPGIDLLGVTTVHGDAPLRARIARALLTIVGRTGVPVVAGASRPLAPPTPSPFHWRGLRGVEGRGILPDAEREPSPAGATEAAVDDAAAFIVERARADPGAVSLVAVGPLTNVARAIRLEPRLPELLLDLTVMGGAVDLTHCPWPPVLETNFNADPEAARDVLESGIPLTVVPIEVTTGVFLTAADRDWLGHRHDAGCDDLLRLIDEMAVGFAGFSAEMDLPDPDIFRGRTFMHDPLAVHVAAGGDLASFRRTRLRLAVIDGVLRTLADGGGSPNVRLCTGVDAPAFVHRWLVTVGGVDPPAVHRLAGRRPPGLATAHPVVAEGAAGQDRQVVPGQRTIGA